MREGEPNFNEEENPEQKNISQEEQNTAKNSNSEEALKSKLESESNKYKEMEKAAKEALEKEMKKWQEIRKTRPLTDEEWSIVFKLSKGISPEKDNEPDKDKSVKSDKEKKEFKPDFDSPDYYKRLGVSRDASIEEIKEAYRAAVKKTHPDLPDGGDRKKFESATSAFEILGNPEKRTAYDAISKVEKKEAEKEAEDEILSSEWAKKAKEFFKKAGEAAFYATAGAGVVGAGVVVGAAREAGKGATKLLTSKPVKKTAIFSGFAIIGALAITAKMLYGILKFAKKAIEKKGNVSFKEGYEIGGEIFSFESKKEKK